MTEALFNGYVGMPAALHLDEFARHLRAMFNTEVYLVGSALVKKDWHDLDVRVILPDQAFYAMGFGAPENRFHNKKWISLCLAYSALGKQIVGHTIDFQIVPQSYSNLYHCQDPSLPIGLS